MQKKIRRFLALMMALMIALMMLFPLLAIATEPIAVDVSESIRLSPSDSPAPEAPEETIPESGADETEEIPLPEVNGEPQPDVSAQPDSAPVTGAPDETEASAESDPSFEGAGETIVSEENAAPDGEDGALGISLSETDSPLPEAEGGSLADAIAASGHAYVIAAGDADVYSSSAMLDLVFTVTQDSAILLATEVTQQGNGNAVRIWLITTGNEAICGYISETALTGACLSDEEAYALTAAQPAGIVASDAGELIAFVVEGQKRNAPVSGEKNVPNAISAEPAESSLDSTTTEDLTPELPPAQAGDFIAVTTQTGAYEAVDEDGYGDWFAGCFTRDASVQVEAVEQDGIGRWWYKVRYLYGDDFTDGTLKWTETGSLYVLASETAETAEQTLTVTDYAYDASPDSDIMLMASPMNGFSLKTINAAVPSLYVGQSGVYGSSGKDSDYLQIAKAPDHGTVYATPHYLNGYTVYCLEHRLPGPGENISGGGQQPTGPYVIVDIDTYRSTPGYSSIIFHDSTLHAIGWVLRHSYPFMVLDRSDSDNETWSRVAAQFAIRQVIRELEGAQYVRDYWDMDNFYRASGQAPVVYLEYARWLAENGIARAGMTGNITVSGKTSSYANGVLTGTVTLSTDADLIRIPTSAGTITGNTAGSDGSYYYLHSGDTITVSATGNSLTIPAESVSSADEEANFLIGVPGVAIQKVLIPQYGAPNKLQSVAITFDVPQGSIAATKQSAASGATLAGAVFELLDSLGAVIQTQTTEANGIATFANLNPGVYTVREAVAPEGYLLNVSNTQSITVTAGNTSNVAFSNDIMTGKIRIVKRDQLTGEALAGAEFTVTRLSAPPSHNGAGVGDVVAVLTTGADGTAETGWLDWGKYRVEETKVPDHYVDNYFSIEIDAYENGATYEITVENEPTKGFIRLTKTDRLNGNPIEGVRFDIYYNDEYGTGLATTMVTDKDGIAISEPLRKGKYIVREHGETMGYVFEEIALDATVKSDETTELAATNQPVMVRLKLYKRDAEEYEGDIADISTRGDGELTGAEFQALAGENITDRQGNVLHAKGDVVIASVKTSGEDASVTTGELWPGLYEIVELSPPVGYRPSSGRFYVDAQTAAFQSTEAVITYDGLVTNKILYGVLGIVKFLGDNLEHVGSGVVETPEQGAEFEVYIKSAGSYENAREFERDYLKTNRYGKAKTKALPYGVYVLRQVVGAEGHAFMEPIEFMIDGTEDLQDPPSLILNNQAVRYRLHIAKMDAETNQPIALANTAFQLKDGEGNIVTQTVSYPTQMEIDTFLTDDTGSVTLPETVAWGQYFIEEVQSPEGYLLSTEPVSVFIGRAGDDADEVYEVVAEIPNTPVKGKIILEKTGLQLAGFESETDVYGNVLQKPVYEEAYLAGAVFELRAAGDVVGKDGTLWYGADELVETLTTTANGLVHSKELPLGKYYLAEVQAPAGYVLTSERYEVELAFADNQTAVVEVVVEAGNDYLATEITVEKVKEAVQTETREDGTVWQTITNAPGDGFVFGLYSAQDFHAVGGTLMADTLVATGATDANGILTFSGNYPHGRYYIRELAAPEGWRLTSERFDIVLDPANKATGANVIRANLTVHNELIYTTVTLTKTDITGENPLPGALIEVKNSADEIVYRACTDANGQLPNIPVTPGSYTFREILAPDGYALNEAVMRFTVDAEGNVTGDTSIRDDYTRFSLRKQDENGQPLAGVEFGLLQEDGTALFTAVSDENGMVTFERIPYGHYTIVETQPLPGYLLSVTEIRLTVDGEYVNPTETVAVVNVPNHYSFLKVDNESHPLSGVKFALEDADGNVLRELVSGEDGVVRVNELRGGSYTIRETEALEGYIRSEEVIRLVIDDAYTVPEEMYRLVNYPGIQTGVDIAMTPVMWAGAALVVAGALVAVYIMTGKKKEHRRKSSYNQRKR